MERLERRPTFKQQGNTIYQTERVAGKCVGFKALLLLSFSAPHTHIYSLGRQRDMQNVSWVFCHLIHLCISSAHTRLVLTLALTRPAAMRPPDEGLTSLAKTFLSN